MEKSEADEPLLELGYKVEREEKQERKLQLFLKLVGRKIGHLGEVGKMEEMPLKRMERRQMDGHCLFLVLGVCTKKF